MDLSAYDFVDFGCSKGGSIEFARNRFGGRGVGIDIDPAKVSAARAAGYDAIEADLSTLDPRSAGKTGFAIMSHFLEHLPTFSTAKKCIASACKVSRNFVLIQQPYFDADAYLFGLRLKLFWSDWRGHTLPMTTLQLYRCFVPLLASTRAKRLILGFRGRLTNSRAPEIHSIFSAEDELAWDKQKHPGKVDVNFSFPVYKETCVVALTGLNRLTPELEKYLKDVDVVWDSADEFDGAKA